MSLATSTAQPVRRHAWHGAIAPILAVEAFTGLLGAAALLLGTPAQTGYGIAFLIATAGVGAAGVLIHRETGAATAEPAAEPVAPAAESEGEAAATEPAGTPARGRWPVGLDWIDGVLLLLPSTLIAGTVAGVVLVAVAQATDRVLSTAEQNAVEALANQVGLYLGGIFTLWLVVRWRHNRDLAELGIRAPRRVFGISGWWCVPIAILTAVVALIIANWLGEINANLLQGAPSLAQNTQCTTVRNEFGPYIGIAIPVVCVMAPMVEETMFRGCLYGWLRRHLAIAPAVAIAGFVFGAVHLVPVLFLPLFFVGMVLAVLYETYRSLLPGVLLHACFNLPGIIAILGSTTTC